MVTRSEDIPHDQLSGPLRRASVKKHVAAIHVSGKLTLLQRKLSNVLLLNAYDDLITKTSHRIDARTLCMMIGYNSNDMETLKASLRSLAETVAEWDMLDSKGRQEWGVSALLSYAKLKSGICEYAYSPALAEKLHDPKVFALINLNIQRRFSSGHALALYENCYRFVRTGSTGWLEIDLFRRLMGVDGSAYYETYKHLNAKIIKSSVAEINRTSNIFVTPEVRRQGRAVSHIRFLIKENPQLAMFDIGDEEGVRDGPIYSRLVELGVSDRLARQWISEHGEDRIEEKLTYVQGRKGVKSPVRYLAAAIRDDFDEQNTPTPEPPSEDALAAVERARLRQATEEVREARLAEARRLRVARLGKVAEIAGGRTPTQRDADRQAFLSTLSDPLDRADFERNGWRSALNATAICAFWDDLSPGLFDGAGD